MQDYQSSSLKDLWSIDENFPCNFLHYRFVVTVVIPSKSNELHYLCQCVRTVHGKEYGFGAHDFAASGVFEVEPRSCPGFIYRSSISLGRITMLPSEFRTFIENAASEYHGDTYHLISKNCNHFTDDISWRLTGKHIPGWVNRLARLGMKNFMLTDLPFLLSITSCSLNSPFPGMWKE